jgi:hypothetical protein
MFNIRLGSCAIEGAAALLLAVIAYKLHGLRAATESGCCGSGSVLRVKTSNRGDSNNNLEMPTIDD